MGHFVLKSKSSSLPIIKSLSFLTFIKLKNPKNNNVSRQQHPHCGMSQGFQLLTSKWSEKEFPPPIAKEIMINAKFQGSSWCKIKAAKCKSSSLMLDATTVKLPSTQIINILVLASYPKKASNKVLFIDNGLLYHYFRSGVSCRACELSAVA